MRGGADTAVPDTTASYTRPSGPNPRTTSCGGRGEWARLHQTPRHHTLKREGGGGGTALPDTAASYPAPRPTTIVTRGRPAGAHRVWRQRYRGRVGTAVPDTAASYAQYERTYVGTTQVCMSGTVVGRYAHHARGSALCMDTISYYRTVSSTD